MTTAAMMQEGARNTPASFGPVHVIEPQTAHTHTAIVLHGRGSDGQEFADDLFGARLSDGKYLVEKFTGWRWVFPSSKECWSTTFMDYMPSWFEAVSLTDTNLRQDLQIAGIMDSSRCIQTISDDEIRMLHGDSSKLIFGGVSQGGALALWMLLCRGTGSQIGAFFAASAWLPFAENISHLLSSQTDGGAESTSQSPRSTEYDGFILRTMQESALERNASAKSSDLNVFLGHGLDDAYVDVALGRQASHVLSEAGYVVEWKVYSGAEQEGHWLQEPDEMDDIRRFMRKSMAQTLSIRQYLVERSNFSWWRRIRSS